MKIRQGFVSNSSTSSFLIFGTIVSTSDIRERAAKVQNKNNHDEDDYDYDYYELSTCRGVPYDSGDLYLGLSWSGVKDDETGSQFKQRVIDEVKKELAEFYTPEELDALEFNTYKEAWHD